MASYVPELSDIRHYGQIWTPAWIADAMAAYAMTEGRGTLFDPACGTGALLAAGKRLAGSTQTCFRGEGMDVDPRVLAGFEGEGLTEEDANRIRLGDYLASPPSEKFSAIAVNPPYVRHHRIGETRKRDLQSMVMETLGHKIDARAGLHVYFLIQSLRQLAPNGRLAFIASSDICEGVFSTPLWSWILGKYRLDAVLRFSQQAAPFPGADTNAMIFFIHSASPRVDFAWAQCMRQCREPLLAWVEGGFKDTESHDMEVQTRRVDEAIRTGLSRAPSEAISDFHLSDVASVVRGIATGANDFFLMTREQAAARNLPSSFLKPCIARVRDLDGDRITPACLERLEKKGRPTLLLDIPATPFENLPDSVKDWIREGEALGFHNRPLIKTRRPWYRMEQRKVPPLLFAYLGRRDCRFILNDAGVVPLSCLLCVYPKHSPPRLVWETLNRPESIANLAMVGKSYGGGAIKVEPRGLERLPISNTAMESLLGTMPIQDPLLDLAIS